MTCHDIYDRKTYLDEKKENRLINIPGKIRIN